MRVQRGRRMPTAGTFHLQQQPTALHALLELNPRFGCIDLTAIAAAPGVRVFESLRVRHYQPVGLLPLQSSVLLNRTLGLGAPRASFTSPHALSPRGSSVRAVNTTE